MSLQGGVIDWVADHRKYHTFTDEEGDPHCPHAGHGAGLRGMVAGPWHAHVGWLFQTHGEASSKRFPADLVEDRTMRRINRSFPLIALGSLLLPFVLGVALSGGSLVGAPHHVEHQLDLALLRQPPLRHRRSLDERVLAGAAFAGEACITTTTRSRRRVPRPALV